MQAFVDGSTVHLHSFTHSWHTAPHHEACTMATSCMVHVHFIPGCQCYKSGFCMHDTVTHTARHPASHSQIVPVKMQASQTCWLHCNTCIDLTTDTHAKNPQHPTVAPSAYLTHCSEGGKVQKTLLLTGSLKILVSYRLPLHPCLAEPYTKHTTWPQPAQANRPRAAYLQLGTHSPLYVRSRSRNSTIHTKK